MKPYSTGLRAKIVAAYHSSNSSQAKVARRFGVSEATVKKLLRRKRLHGLIEPLPHRGGQQLRAAEDIQAFVIAMLIQHNDLTLQELCEAVYEHCKLTLSTATMCRLPKKLGFTQKNLVASQQHTAEIHQEREDYRQQVASVQAQRFRFIDEAGANLAMTHRYARARRGQRAHGDAPLNYGSNLTMIAALGVDGLSAPMTIEGAIDGAAFIAYVEQVLALALLPGQIVVMDNLGSHRVDGVRQAIEARGAMMLYLPRYSPDMNPIEQCWSKIKTIIRGLAARTHQALDEAIVLAMNAIRSADACAWFSHCGYRVH